MSLQALLTEARSLVEALPAGTVENFLVVLTSRLTQYDQNLARREVKKGQMNIYRLGNFLRAKQIVSDEVKDVLQREDPEALNRLKKAINKNFSWTFAPAKATIKQIDLFLSDGVLPTLVRGKK